MIRILLKLLSINTIRILKKIKILSSRAKQLGEKVLEYDARQTKQDENFLNFFLHFSRKKNHGLDFRLIISDGHRNGFGLYIAMVPSSRIQNCI